MLKTERQDSIVRMVDKDRVVTVKELADALEISEMTVRRDLEELSQAGRVERVHGGAKSLVKSHATVKSREFSHDEKRQLNGDAKEAAAQAAVRLINEGDTIFLGTGTTVEKMVPLLPNVRLRIVTNSLAVFGLIRESPLHELFLVGGSYRPSTMAFVGPLAESAMTNIGVTKAFIGANGILENQPFTSTVESGRIQTLAFNAADERYIVADSSKFGTRDFYCFYDLSKLDGVITDAKLSQEMRDAVERYCTLITA